MDKWDPIELAAGASTDIVTAARKREIDNILKSYVGFYDPFCELIQNALDAVDIRAKQEEDGFSGHIHIKIDLVENSISVTDNGISFDEEKFRLFLSPSVSFKSEGETRGNKGVGATYLGYGFNYLQLGTRSPNLEAVCEIRDGRKWLDDSTGVVPRPLVCKSELYHEAFASIDQGSTFTIKLVGDNIRPKNLGWISANTAEQWRTILLIKTPLGCLCHDAEDEGSITFDLEVIDKTGKETSLSDVPCQYVYPHGVINSCARVADILAAQQTLIEKGRDPSKLPYKFKKLNGVYDFWQTEKLKDLVTDNEHKELIETYGIWAYGYFCYSAPRVLDKFSDETAGLRKGLRILRGGLQLATNSMPQGDLIRIPLTSNIGYQNQAHIVVHLSNAEPDLGRKGFQPELQQVAERISVVIVNQLKRWRHLLLRDSGPGLSHEDELKLDDWINTQKAYEAKNPINLENENFFVPINRVSITAQPVSEQDVVALFNQLIAGGVVRGVRVMASSGHKQYDGLFRYHLAAPLQNHVYDATTNPLGVIDPRYDEDFVSKPYVLEYKFDLDRLIEDFENEEKQEGDIDLVIVWSVGKRWKERYRIVSLLIEDNLHLRPFHGITHELYDDNTGDKRLDLVVLSDLVFYLNDPAACSATQEHLYESDY